MCAEVETTGTLLDLKPQLTHWRPGMKSQNRLQLPTATVLGLSKTTIDNRRERTKTVISTFGMERSHSVLSDV